MIPIANFEEKYLITPEGKIFNKKDNTYKSLHINNKGYLATTLSLNGVKKQILVHIIVALHYIPNPYKHPIVNHMDGNKTNPNKNNLEWVDESGNAQHALKTGLRKGYLSLDNKLLFLNRVLLGETIRSIANEIGRKEEVLSRMLRITAKRIGKEIEWKEAMYIRRKKVAIRNLEKNNYNRT